MTTRHRSTSPLKVSIPSLLLAALLTACGGSGSDSSSTNGTSGTAKEQTIEAIDQAASADSIYSAANLPVVAITATTVNLGELSTAKSLETDSPNGVAKVGLARDSMLTSSVSNVDEKLKWTTAENGGKIAAIQFVSTAAQEIRIGLLAEKIPNGALFRTYPSGHRDEAIQTTGAQILDMLQANQQSGDSSDEARTWWAPSVENDEITLEIELPEGVSSNELSFSIPKVIHVYANAAAVALKANAISGAETRAAGDSASCQLDSSCYADYATIRNSVALIKYLQNGVYYQCTATLLNNTQANRVPYVATANHCISKQTIASTMESTWFFRSNSCNSLAYSSGKKSRNGATLLSTHTNPDFTLLRLNDTPPTGVTYAGWSTAKTANGASVVGIHHPSGDLQKISLGAVKYSLNCTINADTTMSCASSSSSTGNMYQVTWSKGITEVGSSGSALFANNKFVGLLSGGSSTCYGGDDLYTRFDQAFSAVRSWLAPSAS